MSVELEAVRGPIECELTEVYTSLADRLACVRPRPRVAVSDNTVSVTVKN